MLEKSKQIQQAGDNSLQIQGNTINLIQGITEERAREICNEVFALRGNEYTQEAVRIAQERVDRFKLDLVPKMAMLEGALNIFSDPSFQLLLAKAQRVAAASGREADYHLLTELLRCRVQKGQNRKNRTGIEKAVEIVDQIDDDALCGLTIAHAIGSLQPSSSVIADGLDVLSELFEKLLYLPLPKGTEWIDHLDVLGAIRISNVYLMKPLEQVYEQTIPGIMCAGIKKDSENYTKSMKLLMDNKIPHIWLVDNELLNDYVRIPCVNIADIENYRMRINGIPYPVKMTEQQLTVIREIWTLYDTSDEIKRRVYESFLEKWNRYPVLQQVNNWWKEIPVAFNITCVGTVLAHANAQRCDNSIPDLI